MSIDLALLIAIHISGLPPSDIHLECNHFATTTFDQRQMSPVLRNPRPNLIQSLATKTSQLATASLRKRRVHSAHGAVSQGWRCIARRQRW
jgi:hypothetical protein